VNSNEGGSVVALGGGHGLSATLRALVGRVEKITGIVATVDDGGSSGRLREHLGIIPPGDLRMALAALMPEDPEARLWRRVLQHRFDGEVDIGGHAVGNLVLAALWAETGDVVDGITTLGTAMRAHGAVLPNALEAAHLIAHGRHRSTGETRVVSGQSAISATELMIESLRLEPPNPRECPESVAAIGGADALIFGPGSWFTSVLPHLHVPSIRAAIQASSAPRILIVNLSGEPGETQGYPAHAYLESWQRLCADIPLNVVLADPRHVLEGDRLRALARTGGADLVLADLERGGVHDPRLLGEALQEVLRTVGEK
jgi:uncharacterized cofD-like protein